MPKCMNCVSAITATIAPEEALCILLACFLSIIIKGISEDCEKFRDTETRTDFYNLNGTAILHVSFANYFDTAVY